MQWLLLLAGIAFPATLSLLDCWNRPATDFAGGDEDRRAWIRWLAVAVPTSWIGVGLGIVLGYYYAVVKRNPPA